MGKEMNRDRIVGNWKQLKGYIQYQWGRLTDDQLNVILGKRQTIAGKIQEIYGIVKDEERASKLMWQGSQKNQA
jgi:uncharacterized protein YjbJ (UPF0337 family)